MKTQCFFASLRRFISRRRLPSQTCSDNGTTFNGACNDLRTLEGFIEINRDTIQNFADDLHIVWKFIPSYDSNFGILWGAAVKQMKRK